MEVGSDGVAVITISNPPVNALAPQSSFSVHRLLSPLLIPMPWFVPGFEISFQLRFELPRATEAACFGIPLDIYCALFGIVYIIFMSHLILESPV